MNFKGQKFQIVPGTYRINGTDRTIKTSIWTITGVVCFGCEVMGYEVNGFELEFIPVGDFEQINKKEI